MRYLVWLPLTALLTGCTSSFWPGNATPTGHNFFEEPISSLYEHGSAIPLGTTDDQRQIKEILSKVMPGYKVTSVRWISPDKVLVLVEQRKSTYSALYCALEKDESGWRYVTSYLGTVS